MRVTPSTWAFVAAMATIAAVGAAAVEWDNVADEVGVEFQQAGEIHGPDFIENPDMAFPELIGSGACLADLDGDGYDDLYLVSEQYNPENMWTEPWSAELDVRNKLFVNDGDGTFTDRTGQAGLASRTWGYGCSAADYDADGDLDLFLANFGPNELYRNDGDLVFTNVTVGSGLGMNGACGAHRCMSTNSAWGDYDGDGDLDLFVSNYVETDLNDFFHGPGDHIAQVNFLHRNNGDGSFTEVGDAAGVAGHAIDEGGSKSFAAVWFDHDLDGDLDLYVANDLEPNEFYDNDGDGTFTDRSEAAGLDDPRASMGLTIGDYDGDAYPDIFITHYETQEFGFYHNNRDGTFEDRSGEDGLHDAGDWVGWGTHFVDIERDGDLDLVMVNGHTAYPAPAYSQPSMVFRQDANPDPGAVPWDRAWVDVSDASGAGIAERSVARGAAFGDYDLDGDTDFAVNNNANQTAKFLRASGADGQFLNVRLADGGPNTYAIGAKVKLEATGLAPQYREVQAGASYLSQNSLTLEFGLGDATHVDRITVTWPDGGISLFEDVAAGQTVRLDRTTGAVVRDVLSPLTAIELAGSAGTNGWFRGAVEATLVPEDRGSPFVSGVALTEVAAGGDAWTPYEGEVVTFPDEGTYEVHARSVDAAGNTEPRRTADVRIDATAPTTEANVVGFAGDDGWWVLAAPSVELDAFDALSGVAEVRYRIDAGAWQVYGAPFEIADDGAHVVEHTAVDVAGNDGAVVSLLVRVDTTAPEVEILAPDGGSVLLGELAVGGPGAGPVVVFAATTHDGPFTLVEVRADAADETSGVDRLVFLVDNEARAVVPAGAPFTWTWDPSGEAPGAHELEVLALDVAGNVDVDDRVVIIVSVPPAPEPREGARAGPLAPDRTLGVTDPRMRAEGA